MDNGKACCKAWDTNPLIAETPLVHARLDAFPVSPGHALVIPKRHVVSFIDLSDAEWEHCRLMMELVCEACDANDFTIGINEGRSAGRTIDHLHIHVIPRWPGDVADPRGGVRRLLIPDVAADPWITRRSDDPLHSPGPSGPTQ